MGHTLWWWSIVLDITENCTVPSGLVTGMGGGSAVPLEVQDEILLGIDFSRSGGDPGALFLG